MMDMIQEIIGQPLIYIIKNKIPNTKNMKELNKKLAIVQTKLKAKKSS